MAKEPEIPFDAQSLYDDYPNGMGEIPNDSNIPVHLSQEVLGLGGNDFERYGQEVRQGSVGRKIVELRNRGLHVATQIRPGRVEFWASEHRPFVKGVVFTALTASSAAGIILFRKSRQKRQREDICIEGD